MNSQIVLSLSLYCPPVLVEVGFNKALLQTYESRGHTVTSREQGEYS